MTVVVAPVSLVAHRGVARRPLVHVAHARLVTLALLFAAGVLAILVRLTILALSVEPAQARDLAAALVPLRADITDRNGEPLARTIDAWSIGVHPARIIGDKGDLARRLAELLPERSAAEYLAILKSGRSFQYLRRRAVPELIQAVNALGEPGLAFSREPERLYPQGEIAAHALGSVSYDGAGLGGMERALNDRLSGAATRATPVALSISLPVQAAFESELAAAMADFQARGAAGVILDVDTGEIVSIVSLPTFNPNKVRSGDVEAMRNNVTQARYELGSTFKPLTAALALDTGVVGSLSRRFDATEPLQVGRFHIRDDHPQRRWLNLPEMLTHSSNIVTARIADELGNARMLAMFRQLGFDTPPAIELGEKSPPLWPNNSARVTTMTMGYGHGIAVTPLHLASAYAALVNGGIWRPATLMRIEPGKAPQGRRVFTEETSAQMRGLLRLIVTDGTGRFADAPGYRVGGKTGTAERPDGGGYSRNKNVSTFAAAFPMDAPRYVVIAMLDSPVGNARSQGQATAGWTAAPVVGRAITRVGPLLGVMPEAGRDVDLAPLRARLWRASPATATTVARPEVAE